MSNEYENQPEAHEYEELAEPYDHPRPSPSAPPPIDPPSYESLHTQGNGTNITSSLGPSKCVGLIVIGVVVVGSVIGATVYVLSSRQNESGDGWGKWGAWGACDVTCGGGRMTRSRECLVDTCTGSPTQVTECAMEPCSPESGDGWGAWGAWGACDVTCGGGWMTRSRECLVDTCTGSPTQVTLCATDSCPTSEFPEWSSWQSWSACTVTCGDGTQNRERTCDDGEDACTGNSTQTRSCPGWSCPDCSQPCPGGGAWNTSCTWCECLGSDVTGKVLSSHNTPLAGVTVSPVHAPYITLDVTNTQGDFTVTDVCIGQMLLFTKAGHVELPYEVTTVGGSVQVKLQAIVPLSISTQPERKSRLVGESVVLCCTAIGSPPPQYYEWFHGSEIVLTDMTSAQSVLILDDLQESQEGDYRCRANNDFSAIFSEPATLQIKANEADYCPSSPTPNRIQLPYGCKTQGGALAYDVGKCSEAPCRREGENQTSSCQPDQMSCCAPTAYGRVDLVCDEGPNFIFEVTSCGCIQCREDSQVVSGDLQAADTSEPVPYGRVQLQDGQSVSADAMGHFVFNLLSPRQRIALTVTDVYGSLVRTTKVVYVNSLTGATSVIIKLLRKAEPVIFDASDETFLTMGSESGDGVFAGIKIPPGSVFTDTGSVFTGDVVARLNVIDPRNITDIENAPSDFMYVDTEGNEQMLDTYGMFSLQAEDSSGNPLHIQGDIEVSLDAELITNDTVPNMYILDANGQWVEIASMHTREVSMLSIQSQNVQSSAIIGNVPVTVTNGWINLDYPSYWNFCASKVRVYENNAYLKFVAKAQPYVVTYLHSKYQKYSQLLDSKEGYCVVHPCDIRWPFGTKGYVMVEYNSKRAYPVSDDNIDDQGIKDEEVKDRISYETQVDAISADMSFRKLLSSKGPYYTFSGATSIGCRDALEGDNHFRFHQEEVSAECGKTEDSKKLEFPIPGIVHDINYYAWYTKLKDFVPSVIAHTAVYIKVLTSGRIPIVFQAISEVGNNTQGMVQVGHQYGYTMACTEGVEAVCLELKPSGEVSDGGPPYIPDDTFIRVQIVNNSRHLCKGYSINPKLNPHLQPDPVLDFKFELSLNEAFRKQETHLYAHGVYWYTGDSTHDLETVRKRTYDACRTGVNPYLKVEDKPTNRDNPALEFFCD